MSDLHRLPLLGHDIPWDPVMSKVKVRKIDGEWVWIHYCPSTVLYRRSCDLGSWVYALRMANRHARNCR